MTKNDCRMQTPGLQESRRNSPLCSLAGRRKDAVCVEKFLPKEPGE